MGEGGKREKDRGERERKKDIEITLERVVERSEITPHLLALTTGGRACILITPARSTNCNIHHALRL